jgi:uncharacterized membrane protein
LLGFGFLAVRMMYFENRGFAFLVWNLFLAWIPYACSLAAAKLDERGRRGACLLAAAAWLAFFPNAPYIVTDLVHLRPWGFAWWYDLGLILTFAWTGCFLAVASLHAMREIVRRRVGAIASWLFVFITAGLSGVGIYLGRFLRWNSWDVLTQPHALASDLASRLAQPHVHPRTLGVTLMFSAFLLMCYVTFVSFRREAKREDVKRQT